jgi:hypothetical protein
VQIQEYLVSSIQNIDVLLRYGNPTKRGLWLMAREGKRALTGAIRFVLDWTNGLILSGSNGILSTGFAIPGSQKNKSSKSRRFEHPFGQQPVNI